ncbi:MAG: glycosyltransferase [Bacteroidetes bacterium]|nr:MAG: glycosyltransferase [Bacteroidota bacterium]
MVFVSVLMPVYNGEKFLSEAIESILHQTYSDFEFLIIDDGSRDNSVEIIKSYQDKRIRLIRNTSNLGITKTLNRGIAEASGKYICRMDADDVSISSRIQHQVEYLETHSDVALVGSRTKIINSSGEGGIIEFYPLSYQQIRRSIFIHNPFAHSAVMIRRSVFNELGVYDTRFLHNEDYDLWLRIAAKLPVVNLDEVLLLRRVHEMNITVEKELELIRHRITTLNHAIFSYYKKPEYVVYLLRPLAAYLWRLFTRLFPPAK